MGTVLPQKQNGQHLVIQQIVTSLFMRGMRGAGKSRGCRSEEPKYLSRE
jgi:hypothetical protein